MFVNDRRIRAQILIYPIYAQLAVTAYRALVCIRGRSLCYTMAANGLNLSLSPLWVSSGA